MKYTCATYFIHFGWDRDAFCELPTPTYFILTPETIEALRDEPVIKDAAAERYIVVDAPSTPDDLARCFSHHAAVTQIAGMKFLGDTDSDTAKAVIERLAQQLDMLGNDVEDTFIGYEHVKANESRINASSRSSDLSGLGKGQIALCIASGPSVAKHLDDIRRLQDSCTIICADSILDGLLSKGIHPHYVTAVERVEAIHQLLEPCYDQCATHLVALPVCHPRVFEQFDGRTTVWWNSDDLYTWMDQNEEQLISGRSTGTMTVAVAARMGFDDVYLVGHDLCYGETTSHSELCMDLVHTRVETRTTEIMGNDGLMHPSQFYWNAFRQDIELIADINKATRWHNVNHDCGAVINGMAKTPLPQHIDGVPVHAVPFKRHAPITACTDVKDTFLEIRQRMDDLLPQMIDPMQCPEYEHALAVDNKLYQYVMRACLRNIALRLNYDNAQTSDITQIRENTLYAQRRYATVASAYITAFKDRL